MRAFLIFLSFSSGSVGLLSAVHAMSNLHRLPCTTPRVETRPWFTIKMSTEIGFSAVPMHLPGANNGTHAVNQDSKPLSLLTTALLSQCLGTSR